MPTKTAVETKTIKSRRGRLFEIYEEQEVDPAFAHLRYQNRFVAGYGNTEPSVMFVRTVPSHHDQHARRSVYYEHDPIYGRLLSSVGLDFDSAYFTTLLKYRPQTGRDPRLSEIVSSREYLYREIRVVRPSVVVTMGAAASYPFIGSDDWAKARVSSYRRLGTVIFPITRPEQCHVSPHMIEDLATRFTDIKEFLP